jgi:hypothetical protein
MEANKSKAGLSVDYFLRVGKYKSGRLPFYNDITFYLQNGWQFFPDSNTNLVERSWKILRKFKRIRARVHIRTAEMNGQRGVILYRNSKRFGDESLTNALAVTRFMSGTVITL